MSIRLVTPGRSGSRETSPTESVTARETLRRTTSGSSSRKIDPGCWSPADFDILRVGSARSMIRAPAAGCTACGTEKTRPYVVLNRIAMSRASSTC